MKTYWEISSVCREFLFVIVLSTIILFIHACRSDITAPVSPNGDLLLLNIGNQWILKYSFFDLSGDTTKTSFDTTTVVADTLIGNQRWFYRYYLGHKLAYRNTENGVLVRLVSKNTPLTAYLQYKYPTYVGDVFNYPIVFFAGYDAWLDNSEMSATVLSVDTSISVPAGTFACYRYRIFHIQHPSAWQEEYIAPKFGWIKKEAFVVLRDGRKIKTNSGELVQLTIK